MREWSFDGGLNGTAFSLCLLWTILWFLVIAIFSGKNTGIGGFELALDDSRVSEKLEHAWRGWREGDNFSLAWREVWNSSIDELWVWFFSWQSPDELALRFGFPDFQFYRKLFALHFSCDYHTCTYSNNDDIWQIDPYKWFSYNDSLVLKLLMKTLDQAYSTVEAIRTSHEIFHTKTKYYTWVIYRKQTREIFFLNLFFCYFYFFLDWIFF